MCDALATAELCLQHPRCLENILFSNPRRDALSDALATAELSERAAAYIPLSLPPDAPGRLPLMRWPGGWEESAYWGGALLAAAVDTATLPLRLAGACACVRACFTAAA